MSGCPACGRGKCVAPNACAPYAAAVWRRRAEDADSLLREIVAAIDDPASETACPSETESLIREHLRGAK